jgi:nucleotide-binding universal stress UspA family protein
MAAIKTILVPTDFSEASRQALRYACSLADTVNASLHIIHVTENPYFVGGYMEVYAPPPDYFEQVERQAQKGLDEMLTADQRQKYRAVLVWRTGSPATEILAYLRERNDIDLVVMATHGRGGVARMMMGSVADKIVRAAPCPVVTIRDLEGSPARRADHAA